MHLKLKMYSTFASGKDSTSGIFCPALSPIGTHDGPFFSESPEIINGMTLQLDHHHLLLNRRQNCSRAEHGQISIVIIFPEPVGTYSCPNNSGVRNYHHRPVIESTEKSRTNEYVPSDAQKKKTTALH